MLLDSKRHHQSDSARTKAPELLGPADHPLPTKLSEISHSKRRRDMSVENHRRFLARPGERRALRTAVALSTATMLGAVGISIANAEPSPPAFPGVFSATDATAD